MVLGRRCECLISIVSTLVYLPIWLLCAGCERGRDACNARSMSEQQRVLRSWDALLLALDTGGLDANARFDGVPLLTWAAVMEGDRAELVRLLLVGRADVHALSDGAPSLLSMTAAEEAGAAPPLPPPPAGSAARVSRAPVSALTAAAAELNVRCVCALLAAGARDAAAEAHVAAALQAAGRADLLELLTRNLARRSVRAARAAPVAARARRGVLASVGLAGAGAASLAAPALLKATIRNPLYRAAAGDDDAPAAGGYIITVPPVVEQPPAHRPMAPAEWFSALDADDDGFVSGAEAREFFLESQLSESALARIWASFPKRRAGHLDAEEFAHMYAATNAARRAAAAEARAAARDDSDTFQS
jgi:hypothetical protein